MNVKGRERKKKVPVECYSGSAQTVNYPPLSKEPSILMSGNCWENDCVIKELTGTVIHVCFLMLFSYIFHYNCIAIVIHIITDLRHYCSMLYINR